MLPWLHKIPYQASLDQFCEYFEHFLYLGASWCSFENFGTHRNNYASKYVYDQMEMNFTKMKEVSVNNRTRNKKTSLNLYTIVIIWEKCPKYSFYSRVSILL